MISPSYVDGLELRIKELTQSNRSFVSALQKAEVYNVQLERQLSDERMENLRLKTERDALVAQGAAYKERSYQLNKLCDELIDHLRYNKAERDEVLNEFWNKQEAIKYVPSEPQPCLVEIKADAGRDGFVSGYEKCWRESYGTKPNTDSVDEYADSYAAKVRQGGGE